MLKNNYILLIDKFEKKERKSPKQRNNLKIQPYMSFISYGSVPKVECYIPKFYFMYCYIKSIISNT